MVGVMSEFDELVIDDVPEYTAPTSQEPPTVPNHKASSDLDEMPDGPVKTERLRRTGLFGQQTRTDKPPRRERAKSRKPPPENRPGQFVEPLIALYGMIGFSVAPFSPHVGRAIMEQAEPCAEAWDKAAQENESVRRVLKALTTTSVWGSVVMAHAPIVGAIIVNHTTLTGGENSMADAFMAFTGSNENHTAPSNNGAQPVA